MQTQKRFILRIYRGLFYGFLCLSPVTYASNDSILEREEPSIEVSAKRRNLRLFSIHSFTLLSEGLFHKDEIAQQPPLNKLTNTNPHKCPLRLKKIEIEQDENLNSVDNKRTDESRNEIRSLNKFCEDYNKLSGEYPYHYNSALLPGDENGTIITYAPQRELLAQILDLKIMTARLKSQFAYWKEEQTIRKTILAQFKNKMASTGSTSYLGYVTKPNIILEPGEIKMALPPETQLALYKHEFLKHKQVPLKRKKNVKPVVKRAHEAEAWEIDETILPSIIRNEYDQSGEASTKLIHHYNYAHRLSIPELRKQLSELERQYQGITKSEKTKSLLSRFKQVMMKELKLNKLEAEFYKKLSPDSFQSYYVPVR
ncbi:MAG: hypothetical protein IBJ00_07175, partial [Alphaproteobacteria bacterium]|nr:hypothetical protein [Alphaproteobacteria bacterium]